jgi:hypothetical protein
MSEDSSLRTSAGFGTVFSIAIPVSDQISSAVSLQSDAHQFQLEIHFSLQTVSDFEYLTVAISRLSHSDP